MIQVEIPWTSWLAWFRCALHDTSAFACLTLHACLLAYSMSLQMCADLRAHSPHTCSIGYSKFDNGGSVSACQRLCRSSMHAECVSVIKLRFWLFFMVLQSSCHSSLSKGYEPAVLYASQLLCQESVLTQMGCQDVICACHAKSRAMFLVVTGQIMQTRLSSRLHCYA